MALAPLQQNRSSGQVAVDLIGQTVRDNKAPGIAHSATLMGGNSPVFSVRNPPPIRSGGIGAKLDITA